MNNDFREEVRSKIDLLTVIGRTVNISRNTGDVIMVVCPWHADKNPSLAIYPEQGRWHCYGCQEGGDVFAWEMKAKNLDFWGALTSLAREAGVEIPEKREVQPDRDDAEKILKMAADFYHERLPGKEGEKHREYLLGRHFGEKFWEEWHLGAAGSKNELLAFFNRQKISLEIPLAIGLLKERDGKVFDAMRDRVVIPFIDAGKIQYMTGRSISGKEPKYLHLENSKYFRKTPYNWRSRGHSLVVVEGPLDVWAVKKLAGNSGVSAVALMGLGTGDPLLEKAMKFRDRIFVALDSDGTVKESHLEPVLKLAGAERARILQWPGGDDAAKWWSDGATPEKFQELLDQAPNWAEHMIGLVKISPEPEKIERAVAVIAKLPEIRADFYLDRLKKASGSATSRSTLNGMVKTLKKSQKNEVTQQAEKNSERNEDKNSPEKPQPIPYYRVVDGELVRGVEEPQKITSGGYAQYVEMVTVDDGEEKNLELGLEIRLKNGRTLPTRIPAEQSHDPGKVAAAIKKVAGPLLTIEAYQKSTHLLPAIESVSKERQMDERNEIARTGWIEFPENLVFATPGGVVGNFPDGFSVALPQGLERYAVSDQGDEAFAKGLMGLYDGFLKSFQKTITYPLLAFAFLPPAARWIGPDKFVMHLSGETGSLKTATAKTIMSLYGANFWNTPPIASWRSTINSLEHLGFWLPEVLGLVDDYKPRIVKIWDFVDLIQRYADGNDRLRLTRDAQMRRRQAMRWWMLSTGEDIPAGESSVLARMVCLRFPRRPQGSPYNADLAKAQRYANFFPTVMARWIAWLMESGDQQGFKARHAMYQQKIGETIQRHSPDVPNVPRISQNLAMLWAVWDGFWDFVSEKVHSDEARNFAQKIRADFIPVAGGLGRDQAHQIINEKPSRIFLDALQEGIDSGRFSLRKRDEGAGGMYSVLAGWWDGDGVYLLPAMYNEVSKWLRESGQQLGFSKEELYRLMTEEGLIAKKTATTTTTIYVGQGMNAQTRRVIHLKPGVLIAPSGGNFPEISEEDE